MGSPFPPYPTTMGCQVWPQGRHGGCRSWAWLGRCRGRRWWWVAACLCSWTRWWDRSGRMGPSSWRRCRPSSLFSVQGRCRKPLWISSQWNNLELDNMKEKIKENIKPNKLVHYLVGNIVEVKAEPIQRSGYPQRA